MPYFSASSVARGEADEWSDIDLVVIGSDANITPEILRGDLSDWGDRVSAIYCPTSGF
jgi:predicted nucleotidyltransferase